MANSAISIFQKHLNSSTQNHADSFPIRNIKDINEGIGALQMLEICLCKCLKLTQEYQDQQYLDLITNCTFMGDPLFDRTIAIHLGKQKRDFLIQTPQALSYQETMEYFRDKQEEIAEILEWILEAMEQSHQFQHSFCDHFGMIANQKSHS